MVDLFKYGSLVLIEEVDEMYRLSDFVANGVNLRMGGGEMMICNVSVKYLIVGCGRSGTGFLSDVITKSGARCGHEEIYNVNGVRLNIGELEYESSWYSVPFLDDLGPDVKILHLVRNPVDVIRSFYRIGLFAPSIWQHVTGGDYRSFLLRALTRPRSAFDRIMFVKKHRRYFSKYSSILNIRGEVSRLQAYWCSWNRSIEDFAHLSNNQYLRVRIEEFEERKSEIASFLDLEALASEGALTNKKRYERKDVLILELESDLISLATRYGYSSM